MGNGAEHEARIGKLEKENAELAQGFRNLARGDINRRLVELYSDLVGGYWHGHKKTTLTDRLGVLTSHEVPEPFRGLLLEDNPDGILEIEVAPLTPKGEMFIRNPKTEAFIIIGADIMPYTHPQYPSSRTVSPVGEAVIEYREEVKSNVVKGYLDAEKLIYVIRQIAAFDNKLQV